MTPVEYTYGDRQLLRRIVKDYTGILVDTLAIPESYTFVQSSLIEYLSVNKGITEASVISLLDHFSIKIEAGDEATDGHIYEDQKGKHRGTPSTSEYSEIIAENEKPSLS